MIETQASSKIERLGLDNGEEYKSDSFLYVKIRQLFNTSHVVRNIPLQDGSTKRMNQSSLKKV